MTDEHPDIHWSNQLEDLIAGEAEKCRGLSWIHQHAEQIASARNNLIQIPVIVLSTLCGTASVSSSTLFGQLSRNPVHRSCVESLHLYSTGRISAAFNL